MAVNYVNTPTDTGTGGALTDPSQASSLVSSLKKGGYTGLSDPTGLGNAPVKNLTATPAIQPPAPTPGTAVIQNGKMVIAGQPAAAPNLFPHPTVPTPPAFSADVPSTMDAGTAAKSVSAPATVPAAIPATANEPQAYQMADGRFYSPQTGLSGATKESVLTPGAQDTTGAVTTTTTTGTGTGTTTPATNAPPADEVTNTINSLYSKPDNLVKQYQDLRTAAGLPDLENKLASTNTEIANMNATINNIENDVRSQAGGQADESFIQATIADRMRRLQPRIDQLNAAQQSLATNIQLKKDAITQQLGLNQQDIQNAATDRENVRKGIQDLLSTYGSAAFANVDPNTLSELEKRAGLPPGSINAQAKTLPEKQVAQGNVSFQVINDRIFKIDKANDTATDTGIVVPPSQKDTVQQAIQAATIIGQTSLDPNAALDFLTKYLPSISGGAVDTSGATTTGTNVASTAKVGTLPDDQLTTLMAAMAQREGFGSDPNNVPTRNNNPGDITLSSAGLAADAKKYGDPGLSTDVVKQPDGSTLTFLKFSSPEIGFRAMQTLLQSPTYANMNVDAALKQWSGNSYGAEILGGAGGGTSGGSSSGEVIGGKNDITKYLTNALASPNLPEVSRTPLKRALYTAAQSGDASAMNDAVKSMAYQSLSPAERALNSENESAVNSVTQTLSNLDKFKSTNPGLWTNALQNGLSLAQQPKNQDWLSLIGQIQGVQVGIQHSVFGSRLTPQETQMIDGLIVNKNDTLSDIKTKLNTLNDFVARKYNTPLNNSLGIFGPKSSKFMVVLPDGSSQFFDTQAQATDMLNRISGNK